MNSSLALPGSDISGLDIHDNTFVDKGSRAAGYEAIYINPDTGLGTAFITDNNFTGNLLRAITSERSDVRIRDNNIITDLPVSADDLSVVGGYQGINIRRFDSGLQSAIIIERNRVMGSDSSKGFNQGIRLGQTGQTFFNIEVENNIISYNKHGINSKIAAGINISDNDIVGNTVNGLFNEHIDGVVAVDNWWGDCTGPSGIGPGTGDAINGSANFTPWKGACVGEKTITPICNFADNNVTLYANVTSNFCIGDVVFVVTIDGSPLNYTGQFTSSISNYSVLIDSGNFTGSQNISWTVWAEDCDGHWTKNGDENFYVNSISNMTVSPSSPDGQGIWYVSEPLFTLSNPDLGGNDLYYRWNGAGFLYTGPFMLDDIPNAPPKESAGTLGLTWFSDLCSAELGKNESEMSETFYIDLFNPDVINLNPANGSDTTNKKPLISAYLEELYQSNSGINLTSVMLWLDGVKEVGIDVELADGLDATVEFTPASDLSTGPHTVTVYVEDNAGRSNNFSWMFNVLLDITPSLTVISPVAGNYDARRILFDLNFTEGELTFIDYTDRNPRFRRLCRNCDSYSRTKNLREGFHNITFMIEDKLENKNTTNVEFLIDSKNPRIRRTMPKRGFADGIFEVEFIEANPVDLTLYYGNSIKNQSVDLNSCTKKKTRTSCMIKINLTEFHNKTIEYWFNLTDIFDRKVESRHRNLKVDTVDPSIDFFNFTLNGRKGRFFMLISEDNLDEVNYIDYTDTRPRERRLCSRLKNGICDKTRTFRRGDHNVTVSIVDDAENSVSVEDILFNVV